MKQDFLDYIQDTFKFSPSEMTEFSCALSKPLGKTLRVNTNKITIEDFKNLAQKNNWVLRETPLGKNMFYIDREDTSLALGHTLEHIAGYFYVQELAASSSPFYMSDDSVDLGEYTILDMSASPGGKTTQLAEYYPNALIIANEIDKSRMRQLHENTDRLSAKNVYVTNYDGRYFGNHPEIFDKILLDAPCSGEGTAYKTDDALKYWNLKNIKRIAKLQYQLLESSFISLKVGGELVYSTCTINRLENEEILNKLTDKYGDYFEIFPLNTSLNSLLQGEMKLQPLPPLRGEDSGEGYIRSWPHKNNTGGFFVAKLIKKESVPEKKKKEIRYNPQGFEKLSNTGEKTVQDFLESTFGLTLPGKFFSYRDEIYYSEKYSEFFWEHFFMYKCGIKIGKLENGEFIPNFFLGTHFGVFEKNSFEVSEEILHTLLKGEEIEKNLLDGYYQIYRDSIPAGIVRIKNEVMKSLLETRFMRK